jgi:murein DD-endopeptidase MepM/ murein hydrolase activator NlpD
MRNIFLTIVLAFIISAMYGQTENLTYKAIADKFEANYNTGKYDSIFAMFSTEMQTALPLDKTTAFLTGLKSQAGQIAKRQFIKYENGTYARYKTNFERALFAVNISVDNNSKINGLFVKPFTEDNLPKLARNLTKLKLPFKGEWTVIWGGDTKELNYHVESAAQKNAFDIVIKDAKGNSFKTDGLANDDYYAFGKQLFAPCDGEIVLVVDGVKDNLPGEFNPVYIPGNTVIMKTANNEYLFFAHFKQHSIKVTEGQKVHQDDVLGLCGNSGNSSEPHVHFHIQNVENMNIATGVKCYFDTLIVNGQIKTNYSPIKKDKIKSG